MFLLFNARSGYFVTKMQFEECLREFAIRLDPNLILGWHALRLCERRVDLRSNYALRRLRACHPNTLQPES